MEETSREAVATAVQRVAGMLQRSDQLDKVEQYRRREARKKASVEARLKAAIQSQLDGVRTGLTQLHTALLDVKDIQSSLANVNKDWRQSINTIENLKDVKDAVVQHSQLAAAVENLKNIFSVPEIVLETQQLTEQGELLQAHRKLMELECSRDDLMYEQYRMDSKNTSDMNLISIYFEDVQRLSDELAKQLWMVLQRSMVTVRRDPTMLVSVVRIIEREEKLDRRMVDRKKQTGFIPPGRPKHWKDKMFQVLEGTVSTRIEGTQAVTREADKMWLVRLLEITRKYVLDDLIVVKNLMVQCFPPHYNTFNRFFSLYHNTVSTRVKELALEDLEANEIVSLLTWVLNTYKSVEMMGHPDLCSEFDINQLEPLLPQEVVDDLLSKYVKTFTSNITGWLRKALETDKKDWYKETEPEADQDGYYQTTLPAIVFQMFEQNLQVAAQIDGDFKEQVLKLCLKQMNSFLMRYREEVVAYKEEHLRDRQLPQCYIQYMIAIVNNCQTFKESINSLKRKYSQSLDPFDSDTAIERTLSEVVKEGCQFLLDEVFLDLESHLNELLSRKWLAGSHAVDTICVTVEDYFNDFNKVKKPFNQDMTNEALRRVVVEYLKAVMQKRITFKNADERKEGAERMIKEAEQFKFLFKKLAAGEDTDRLCGSITAIAEVFKLTDPTLLFLEVTTLVSKYPDIREDHIQALLAVRGDASREMRQMIIGTLSENKVSYSGTTQPIFKDITVPTITTTMTSMTSMATAKLLK
ncbi:exocyst complex component 3 [Gambusia affinis]|uniref:exocyst complex component 3 n=1 Tax=Gambusia affinis TaxID=33528 RepID=UPI001CDCDC91|nr:exocyst complex component 3 [Gambusia affinis]XP_043989349.1 exocyst complex component 3 [Gambusia affinis]XP_043989350.1 exocyst complex component 3 [Gambusia affinis]XP_043989351.1 exocyst complex component 3 [Gambusia affinis]XP_043989352.1 exocyst complex component 3 [Gambusia affinis]